MEEGRQERLLVLYASQTGNAMDAAERAGREAERRGCSAVDVLSMDAFEASNLPDELIVIFVVSTTGQGDAPDAMKAFWRFLLQRNLGRTWLQGLRYAVFGLGDSGYQKYNFTAKKLDRRLMDLGAHPIIEKGLGDDQHPSGYEGALDPWLSALWDMLHRTNPTLLPIGLDGVHSLTGSLHHAKFKIDYHSADEVQARCAVTKDLKQEEVLVERAHSVAIMQAQSSVESQFYFLRVVTNERLTQLGFERDVRHIEFESISRALEYRVGDVLEILSSQDPVAVEAFIRRCKLDPDCYITVYRKSPKNYVGVDLEPMSLRTFVTLTMDVASASPRRVFFEVMSLYATAQHEKERLLYFASPEGRDDLYQYNQKERRTVLEVLEDFPSVQMPFEWLVQLVPPLKTRAFSISSSPKAHSSQVHITVSVVSWMTPYKRQRHGLSSTWLAGISPNRDEGSDTCIPAWIRHGLLPPPPQSLPLVLIGPGTGCAPFRAIIQDRALHQPHGLVAPVLFFFGCRNEEKDFLYRQFWLSHTKEQEVLSKGRGGGFFAAFSRDQPRKVYVQHKMKEESAKIWSLLCAGAGVYIAGSATKMPADVMSALEEIVSEEGGVPKESAERWLKMLEKSGKLFVEAWS